MSNEIDWNDVAEAAHREWAEEERKEALESQLEGMQRQIAQLRKEFNEFRTQSFLNSNALRSLRNDY
jgi:TolA-binding protein